MLLGVDVNMYLPANMEVENGPEYPSYSAMESFWGARFPTQFRLPPQKVFPLEPPSVDVVFQANDDHLTFLHGVSARLRARFRFGQVAWDNGLKLLRTDVERLTGFNEAETAARSTP